MQVFCDFDGTISRVDTADHILSLFALNEWQDIEKQWKNGIIGSGECMQRQIALINASSQQLNAALNEVEIDNHFPEFINFCKDSRLPVTIISDGVDYFIRHILNRHNLGNLQIIANHLILSGSNSYKLETPNSSNACISASGVCKCSMVNKFNNFRVYVGDGRSDFCVSNKVDLLFAKDKLAGHCEKNNIAYIAYKNFSEVTKHLQKILPDFIQSQPKQPIDTNINF